MKLYKLEAIRGFAALYVLLHHTIPTDVHIGSFNIWNLFLFGQEAVMLFFLVSGFVINYSFQTSQDKSFRTYFTKRAVRIFAPLSLVYLACYLLESLKIGGLANPQLGDLLMNVFMLQDLVWATPNAIVAGYMGNGPLWSLSYEWWFYMLYFPIATQIAGKQSQNILVFTVAIIAGAIYITHPVFVPRLLMYMAIWWIGVHLSNLYLKQGSIKFPDIKIPGLILSGLIALSLINVYLYWKAGHTPAFGVYPLRETRHFSSALVFLIGAVFWHKAHWVGFDLLLKPFMFIAPISYGIYITHWNLMREATYFSFIEDPVLRWFSYLAVVVIFSYLIELVFYPAVRKLIPRKKLGNKAESIHPKKSESVEQAL